MDKQTRQIDGREPEVVEIVSAEPVKEAGSASVAEAIAQQAIVVKPKVGLGLAALFSRKRHDDPEPEEAMCEVIEEALEELAPHKNGQLNCVLECMLFVSDGPLTIQQLAQSLELEDTRVEEALCDLETHLDSRGGLQLMRVAGGFQLSTRPEYADYCAKLLQPAKKKLSKAALETLAVVAYRQPCTMPEIEAVRGVAVDGVMKTITERGLVKEAGRKQTPGRPILYATTPEFLEYFGLNDLAELPDIDMLAVEEVNALEARRELFGGNPALEVSEEPSLDSAEAGTANPLALEGEGRGEGEML